MARNETHVDAPPEAVWAVLADAQSYGDWVVGSKHIRGSDPGFPAVGTKLHHTVGFGPFSLDDESEVLEQQPNVKLVLKAKGRPFGTANVVLELRPAGAGTHVTIDETAGDLLSRLTSFNPALDPLVKLRNVETLRRLRRLAEQRATRGA